jgi:flagellin
MKALREFREYDSSSSENMKRISTGKKVSSGKDNAARYSSSELTDVQKRAMLAIQESLNITRNSIQVSRQTSEKFMELTKEFSEVAAFMQNLNTDASNNTMDSGASWEQLKGIVTQMKGMLDVSNFNGYTYIGTDTKEVVIGIKKQGGNLTPITKQIEQVDLDDIYNTLVPMLGGMTFPQDLITIEEKLSEAISHASYLGAVEKTIDHQIEILTPISNEISKGVGLMVDANMEEEAARKAALDVRGQLASQNISMTSGSAERLISLFQ